jgi:hypothetical protein
VDGRLASEQAADAATSQAPPELCWKQQRDHATLARQRNGALDEQGREIDLRAERGSSATWAAAGDPRGVAVDRVFSREAYPISEWNGVGPNPRRVAEYDVEPARRFGVGKLRRKHEWQRGSVAEGSQARPQHARAAPQLCPPGAIRWQVPSGISEQVAPAGGSDRIAPRPDYARQVPRYGIDRPRPLRALERLEQLMFPGTGRAGVSLPESRQPVGCATRGGGRIGSGLKKAVTKRASGQRVADAHVVIEVG